MKNEMSSLYSGESKKFPIVVDKVLIFLHKNVFYFTPSS